MEVFIATHEFWPRNAETVSHDLTLALIPPYSRWKCSPSYVIVLRQDQSGKMSVQDKKEHTRLLRVLDGGMSSIALTSEVDVTDETLKFIELLSLPFWYILIRISEV